MSVLQLRGGGRTVGTMIGMVRSPSIAVMAKRAGLDFLMLDMEHGAASFETLTDLSAAAGAAGIACFVRVPELSRGNVSRALDCGASGVMVPMIETAEQAGMLASWAKYPPLGKRGLGSIGGHTGYARFESPDLFMERANRETLTIAQIETRAGVSAADAIAAVDGIDVLLIGPLDLSVSLGIPGRFDHSVMTEAIGAVAAAARAHGKVFGIHGGEKMLETWLPRGLRMVMTSLDAVMLEEGMNAIKKWFDRAT